MTQVTMNFIPNTCKLILASVRFSIPMNTSKFRQNKSLLPGNNPASSNSKHLCRPAAEQRRC
jgi:hypothetical protein